jgi:hypothetical protein
MPRKPKKSQRSHHSQQSQQVATVIWKKKKYYAKFTEGEDSAEIHIPDYPQTHNGLFALSVKNELYVCAPGKPGKLLKPDDKNCILHKGKQFMLQRTDSGYLVTSVRGNAV